MIRTFHSVGQGAFYTEIHNNIQGGNEFTIVYDCGSTNKPNPPTLLKNQISQAFPKNHTIDILFISHLHNDHMNGIVELKSRCNIKKVIIPLYTPEEIIISLLDNGHDGNPPSNQIINLIVNQSEFFGADTQVIRLKQTPEDDINKEETAKEAYDDINNIPSEIKSASKILSGNEWYFIPFSYKHFELKSTFKSEIERFLVSLHKPEIKKIEDLVAPENIEIIKKHYKTLQKIYERIYSGKQPLNKSSMILFSGKKNDSQSYICCCHECVFYKYPQHNIINGRAYDFRKRLCNEVKSGCLYCGDADLKQTNIISDLKIKLSDFYQSIGTVQIPHHGSIDNYNSAIFDENTNIKIAIISYGINNHYRHPSPYVIGDILEKNKLCNKITESLETQVIQISYK